VRRGTLELGDEAAAARLVGNLLRDWTDLSATDRRELGRGLTAVLRDRPNLLRHHLISGSRTRRVAVDLVRQAQVADVYHEQLRVLAASDADTQLQSAALTAVAEGLSDGVNEVLQLGLNSWDARVRANAVEALDRREAADEVFLRFTQDPSPRVRANAARALIERRRDEGRATLEQMLTGSEAERVSGLWVFSRMRPEGFARTAEMLARRDPSERVRSKAAELLASA
jgi:HEAT repeat protein